VADRTSRSSGSGLFGLVGSLLVLALVLVTMTALGAHVIGGALGHVPGPLAFGGTLGLVLVVCVVVPLLLDRKMVREARRRDPSEQGMFLKTAALVNAVVLLFLVFATPRTTRSALAKQGDWWAQRIVPSLAPPVRDGATWVGTHLPRSGGDEPSAQAPASLASAKPDPNVDFTPQQIFEKFADTVVVIRMVRETEGEGAHGLGSGFFVEPGGVVVTNHHVVEHVTSLEVRVHDGRVFSRVAILVEDAEHDLALVHIDTTGTPTATVAPDDSVAPGSRAIAIGAPLGLEYSITDGIVSAVRTIEGTTLLQMQTTVAPGSSGGPLFDAHGQVIGVNTATRDAGLNLAVSARHVRDLLQKPRAPRQLAPFVR
jgi:S1-C subfamily serine protease